MIKIFREEKNSLLAVLAVEEGNLANSDEFKKEVIKLFDQYHKRIILNLEQVEYIDSSFLGALVSSLKYLITFKSDIILVGLHKDIAEMFELIRLDKVFKIYGSFNEASAH
jgi:anti-sigma B factor antagonist